MALSTTAERLTEVHRRDQIQLRDQLIRDFATLWPLLDHENYAGTLPGYMAAVTALVQRGAITSASLSTAYYVAFRAAEEVPPTDVGALFVPTPVDLDAVTGSLLVTGPKLFNDAMRRGLGRSKAAERSLVATTGTVGRLALNGGRDKIAGAIQRDPVALGFARVSDGNPCYWCAMLCSRGAVYTESTAITTKDGHAYHDGCACGLEPVFSSADYRLPGRGDEFRALYDTSTQGAGYGRDKVNAFRRAYEREYRQQ